MKVESILLLLLTTCFFCQTDAQVQLAYKYSGVVNGTSDSFNIRELPKQLQLRNKNLFKLQRDDIIILSQTGDDLGYKNYNIKKVGIESGYGKQWNCRIADSIYITDYCLLPNDQMMFIHYTGLSIFSLEDSKFLRVLPNTKGLRNVTRLNDSLFLLYEVYPFHPFDGPSLVQLQVYNAYQQGITYEKDVPLEGLSLGNAISQWLQVVNGNIYIVAPLTGRITVYDRTLSEAGRLQIDIPAIMDPVNRRFSYYMDSCKKNMDEELIALKKEKGEAYFQTHEVISSYYNKDALRGRLDSFQKHYTYVEKLFTFNDSTIAVSVTKPEYGMKYRDVYFFNVDEGRVTDSIIKWRTYPPAQEIITRLEDYFTVPLPADAMKEPFFYKGKVYSATAYPVSLFKIGTDKEINSAIYKWQQTNINIWSISGYQLVR